MVNRSPRPYRYTLLWNDGTTDQTTVLAKDPVGWSEHNISFTRSVDFGLDTEYVVPLSFSGQGYNILKSVFERTGAFSVVRVRIEKRNNNWQYYQIYLYRLDFKSYKDNFSTIEIEGIDDSLLSKISANADKEFEIDLPATNKTLIEYTGVTLIKKNLIQCGYGKLERNSNIDTLAFLLKGTRTIRNYTEYFQFTDENGTPYETMTFKVLKTVTQDIEYHLNITIKQKDSSGIPPSGSIKFYKHDANFQNPTLLTDGSLNDVVFASSRSETGGGFFTGYYNNDTFEYSGTIIGANLNAGEYISVFFSALSFVTVSIIDGFDCYISLNSMSESPYENAIIEVFTFEWVISQLLKKINSNAILNYILPDIGYVPVLSCTQAIRNIGKTNGTGKFKAKLKDVLKALNYSYCTAIDISGNTLSVYERSEVYNTTNKGELTVNNIVSEYDDDTHCYNTVKVGGKTKDEYKTKVYPFNCIKTFRIPDTLSEREYNLEHPFEIDCYSIEEMIQETLDKANADNNDKTDFFVLACKKTEGDLIGEIAGEGYGGRYDTIIPMRTVTYNGYIDGVGTPSAEFCIEFSSPLLSGFSLATGHTLEYYANESKKLTLEIVFTTNKVSEVNWDFRTHDGKNYNLLLVEKQGFWNPPNPKYYRITIIIELYTFKEQTYYLDLNAFLKARYSKEIKINSLLLTVLSNDTYSVYKDITSISNFEGDSATIYNLPLSPKRTLLKHLPYISISKWGSEGDIEFETSDRDTNITCQLGYELGEITENDSVEPVTPLFLPVRYTFDTQKEDSSIFDVYGEKYGYYTLTHKKSGKSVSGWVNKAIFAVSKRKQQSWELQAKTI